MVYQYQASENKCLEVKAFSKLCFEEEDRIIGEIRQRDWGYSNSNAPNP